MNEQDRADASERTSNAFARLILENPISAFNTAAILFGGGFVYASNEARVEKMEIRMSRLEHQVREDMLASNAKDDRASIRIDVLGQSVNDLKVTIRGIEASVQYLVQQSQNQQRNERQDRLERRPPP